MSAPAVLSPNAVRSLVEQHRRFLRFVQPEVKQRIAAPMVGGMVTSTVLTLPVIPVLYCTWRHRTIRRSVEAVVST